MAKIRLIASGNRGLWTAAILAGGTLFSCLAFAEQQFPDVVSVEVHARGDNQFDFDVTVSSPYDTPQRYADAFHVMGPDGKIFGERKLLHDHAGEQPFTRDLYGVEIPPGIKKVTVQARDKKYGYGGKTADANLPDR